MTNFLHYFSYTKQNNQRYLKLSLILTPIICFFMPFIMNASASAASGYIPYSSTHIYPRYGGQYPTSDVPLASGSNADYDGALNVVNEGGNNIHSLSNGYYLWCANGEHTVESDPPYDGCNSGDPTDPISNIEEDAFRPQGVLGPESDYDVIVDAPLTNGVQVTLVGGCKIVYDSIGFEDHSYYPLSHGGRTPEALVTGVETPGGTVQAGSTNCDSNGDETVGIPSSAFQPDASLGPYYEEAVLQVYIYNNGTGQKVFGVEATSSESPNGVYIGPADSNLDPGSKGLYTNLIDPDADNYYENDGDCHVTGGAPNCPDESTGGYSALTSGATASPDDGNDTSSNYNFYFSPDCTYSGGPVTLNWKDGQGSEITASNPIGNGGTQIGTGPNQEGWTLTDLTTNTQVTPPQDYNDLGSGSFRITDLQVGHTYDWHWSNVDRTHGISVEIPYTEFTATNEFNYVNDCPSYTLSSKTTVNNTNSVILTAKHPNAGNQIATFSHTITNNGPNAASYDWQIENEYYDATSGTWNGWNINNCAGVSDAGGTCPLRSGTPSNIPPNSNLNGDPYDWRINYEFPDTAGANDKYCQRVVYTNGGGQGSTGPVVQQFNGITYTYASNTVCATYSPPYTSQCNQWTTNNIGSYDNGEYTDTRSITDVTDNSGHTLINNASVPTHPENNNPNYNTQGAMYHYNTATTPDGGPDITITVYHQYLKNSVWTNEAGSPEVTTIPCYSASCTITFTPVAALNDPSGLVVSQAFNVTATITNTGTGLGTNTAMLPLPLNLSEGNPLQIDAYGANGSPSPPGTVPPGVDLSDFNASPVAGTPNIIPIGGTADFSFTLHAPSNVSASTLLAHPAYTNYFGFGSSQCFTIIDTYAPYNVTPNSLAKLTPQEENPNTFNYDTEVSNNTVPGYPAEPVNVQTTNSIYVNPESGGGPDYIAGYDNRVIGADLGAPPPGSANNPVYPVPENSTAPVTSINAGDNYCSDITVDEDGYVGPYPTSDYPTYPNGTGEDPNNIVDTSDQQTSHQCDSVYNEPYFKVYGSGVESTCSANGEIGGWNDDNGTNPTSDVNTGVGSGAQLNAIALGDIVGFASGQTGSTYNTLYPAGSGAYRGAGLTFANTNASDIDENGSMINSPKMGGNFNMVTPACDSYSPPTSGTIPLGTDTIDLGNLSTVPGSGPGGSGDYIDTYPGNITIEDSNTAGFAPGTVIKIYADSPTPVAGGQNVYIADPITYDTSMGTTWSVYNQSQSPPLVEIITNDGSIYIDPNVKQLDGLYAAQSNGGSTANIYTCSAANIDGNDWQPMQSQDLYNDCSNQLVVHGSFVASQVNLMRTYGSLRNTVNPGLDAVEDPRINQNRNGCSNAASDGQQFTCAAEVFDFSPELYLSDPDSVYTPAKSGYDSYTSLPPVL
jgi:hypothetical protein